VRYLRNCVIAKISNLNPDGSNLNGPAAELLQISPDEQRRAARSASLFTEEELTRFLQTMLRTFDELGYRQEQRFHFELGLLKLVHLRRLLPIEEVLSKFSATPAAQAPRPAQQSPAQRDLRLRHQHQSAARQPLLPCRRASPSCIRAVTSAHDRSEARHSQSHPVPIVTTRVPHISLLRCGRQRHKLRVRRRFRQLRWPAPRPPHLPVTRPRDSPGYLRRRDN